MLIYSLWYRQTQITCICPPHYFSKNLLSLKNHNFLFTYLVVRIFFCCSHYPSIEIIIISIKQKLVYVVATEDKKFACTPKSMHCNICSCLHSSNHIKILPLYFVHFCFFHACLAQKLFASCMKSRYSNN